MTIVDGEGVARFVSSEIGFGLCPPYSTMGLEKDGMVIAGIIISQFEGADCHVTVAGKGWTRGFLKAVGEYVFEQLGCLRMTFITEQPHVVQLAVRLGGQVEGCMRDHFGKGRNGHIIGVLKNDYRYCKVPKD